MLRRGLATATWFVLLPARLSPPIARVHHSPVLVGFLLGKRRKPTPRRTCGPRTGRPPTAGQRAGGSVTARTREPAAVRIARARPTSALKERAGLALALSCGTRAAAAPSMRWD